MRTIEMTYFYKEYEKEKEHQENIFKDEQASRQRAAVSSAFDNILKDYSFNLDEQEILFSHELTYVFDMKLQKGESLNQILVKIEKCALQIKGYIISREEERKRQKNE